jgi:hypothetical protein
MFRLPRIFRFCRPRSDDAGHCEKSHYRWPSFLRLSRSRIDGQDNFRKRRHRLRAALAPCQWDECFVRRWSRRVHRCQSGRQPHGQGRSRKFSGDDAGSALRAITSSSHPAAAASRWPRFGNRHNSGATHRARCLSRRCRPAKAICRRYPESVFCRHRRAWRVPH